MKYTVEEWMTLWRMLGSPEEIPRDLLLTVPKTAFLYRLDDIERITQMLQPSWAMRDPEKLVRMTFKLSRQDPIYHDCRWAVGIDDISITYSEDARSEKGDRWGISYPVSGRASRIQPNFRGLTAGYASSPTLKGARDTLRYAFEQVKELEKCIE
jgi:hypothetical protein